MPDIRQTLGSTCDNTTFESILPLHALTGCDTVSFFAGIGKKSAWKIFKTDCHLLVNLGVGELTDQTSTDAEKFVCKLYDVATAMPSNDARVKLFCKGKHHRLYLQQVTPSTCISSEHIIKHESGESRYLQSLHCHHQLQQAGYWIKDNFVQN